MDVRSIDARNVGGKEAGKTEQTMLRSLTGPIDVKAIVRDIWWGSNSKGTRDRVCRWHAIV